MKKIIINHNDHQSSQFTTFLKKINNYFVQGKDSTVVMVEEIDCFGRHKEYPVSSLFCGDIRKHPRIVPRQLPSRQDSFISFIKEGMKEQQQLLVLEELESLI
jgi:hypothetical protein